VLTGERPEKARGEVEMPWSPRRDAIVSSLIGLPAEALLAMEEEDENELMSSLTGGMADGTGLRGRRCSRGEVGEMGETRREGEGGGRDGEWEL
jgi:hypothetical protein